MPRAASASSPSASQSTLRRNQACHQCRKRKLKCDTLLPCGPCTRSHVHSSKTNPTLAFDEPECTYDNPEEVAEGPKAKISRLESRITELEAIIEQKDAELRACTCKRTQGSSSTPDRSLPTPASMSASFGDPPLSPAISDPFARHAPLGTSHGLQAYPESPAVGQRAPSGATDVLSPSFDASDSPGRIFSPPTAGLSQLSHQTWPLNIPPPDLLHHLVETFFASVPFAARLIHRPTFMTNLQQIPTSPDFPHVSLLHAICAIASLYSPVIRDPPAKNFDPTNGATASFDSAILYRKYENVRMNQYFPRRLEDVMGEDDNSFGESHVKWCGATLRMATQRGDRLIQLLEAAIIGCWYSYTTGRSVSTFSWIGIVSRMTLPLGLSASPGYEPLSRLPPHILSLLQEAKNPVEVELHRNLYWLAYSLERVYTAATVWPLTISDDDVSQMMPCRLNDFNSGVYVPIQGRQHLFTHKMLTTHPVLTTDSFTLYLKGSVLLGKVKTFNIRFKMRYTDGGGPTSMGGSVYTAAPLDQDQSQPSPEYLYGAPSSTASSKVDARETAEFQVLDNLIRSFISSIPKEFKDPVPTELEVKLDPVLYTAHLLPHVAMILLHDPHADIGSPDCLSSQRILSSTRSILELIYKLCGTTYDLIYLDHVCSFCWFVAGAALIRLLKVRMAASNDPEVERITQELGVVRYGARSGSSIRVLSRRRFNSSFRFMLSNLGERTIIGLRQIKLLDDIYNLEIGSGGAGASPLAGTAQPTRI